MYGLNAISVNNGWSIAMVGIVIVFSGLVSLAVVISQLHKFIYIYENPGNFFQWVRRNLKKSKIDSHSHINITPDQRVAVKQFALLLNKMPSHFSLPRLLHLAQLRGIKDPHSHLSLLISLTAVFPDNEGFFCWDKSVIAKILKGMQTGKKGNVL